MSCATGASADMTIMQDTNKLIVRSETCSCTRIKRLADKYRLEEIELAMSVSSVGNGARSAPIGKSCYIIVEGGEYVKNKLGNHSCVSSVVYDEVFELTQTLPTQMQQEHDQISGSGVYKPSHTGSGVKIYVIDTGVYAAHEEFEDRVLEGFSAVNYGSFKDDDGNVISNPDVPPYLDSYGHGTCVAGAAAGALYGLASDASIIPVRAMNGLGSGSSADIIGGLSWIVQQQSPSGGTTVDETAVINLSVSSVGTAMNQAFTDADEAGLIIVIAAGNYKKDASLYSPQSLGGNAKNCGPVVVGALKPWSATEMALYSNWGSSVDVLAAGTVVCPNTNSTSAVSTNKSGTSYAAPLVSAILAMYLEKNSMNKCAAIAGMFNDAIYDEMVIPDDYAGTGNVLPQVPSALFDDGDSTTDEPTSKPTAKPTTAQPTAKPTTAQPTAEPTTAQPTPKPTTGEPTPKPTSIPSEAPTAKPTPMPTPYPTTKSPTAYPTRRSKVSKSLTECTTLSAASEAQEAFTLSEDGDQALITGGMAFQMFFGEWSGDNRKSPTDPNKINNWECSFRFALQKAMSGKAKFYKSSGSFSPSKKSKIGSANEVPQFLVRAEDDGISVYYIDSDDTEELISSSDLPDACQLPFSFDIYDSTADITVCM